MTMRRRPSHVRPRPPSQDRLKAAVHDKALRPDIMRRYRPVKTARPMPLAARGILIAAVICLGAGMLLIGSGVGSKVLADMSRAINDAMSHISIQSSPGPQSSAAVDLNTPVLDQPDHGGLTNQTKVTLSGRVPEMAVGNAEYSVRIYAIQSDGKRLRYQDVPVAGTVRFQVDNVPLTAGKNTFAATLVGKTGESGESLPVVYTLDTTPPHVSIAAPGTKASVSTATVVVSGSTEAGVAITVTNGVSPATGDSVSAADGSFKVTVSLVPGDNNLTLTATDVAGNATIVKLAVHRSLGKLAASVTANPPKIVANTSTKVTVTVRATASDGSPLANATVVFTILPYGLQPIQSPSLTTNSLGQASWVTMIQAGGTGPGLVTVDVTTDKDGDVTNSTPLTVVAK